MTISGVVQIDFDENRLTSTLGFGMIMGTDATKVPGNERIGKSRYLKCPTFLTSNRFSQKYDRLNFIKKRKISGFPIPNP